jgi:carboxyl-terminal processing protease
VKGAAARDDAASAIAKLEITDALLEDFKEFLRSRKLEFTGQDINDNIDFIKRRIKQEIFISSFGLQEGFRVAVQGDTQVQKALELMPEAKTLMTTGRLTSVEQSLEIKK